MNQNEIKRLLPLYIEGELDESLAQEIRAALKIDPQLQKEAQDLKMSWDLLGEFADIEPKSNYVSQFWTRLASEQTWWERVVEKFPLKKLVPILATLSVVVIISVIVLDSSPSQSPQLSQPVLEQELSTLSSEDLQLVENLDLLEEIEFYEEIEIMDELSRAEVGQYV